jgi:hypothetical protein
VGVGFNRHRRGCNYRLFEKINLGGRVGMVNRGRNVLAPVLLEKLTF